MTNHHLVTTLLSIKTIRHCMYACISGVGCGSFQSTSCGFSLCLSKMEFSHLSKCMFGYLLAGISIKGSPQMNTNNRPRYNIIKVQVGENSEFMAFSKSKERGYLEECGWHHTSVSLSVPHYFGWWANSWKLHHKGPFLTSLSCMHTIQQFPRQFQLWEGSMR